MPPPKTPKPISQQEYSEGVQPSEVPKHIWEHSGIAPFIEHKTGSFWSSWLRSIIGFLLGALSAAYVVGGKSRDVSDLLVWRGEVKKEIERMNREGTDASRMKVDEERNLIKGNSDAITELYKRIEPIGAMQAKIERLQHDIDAKK